MRRAGRVAHAANHRQRGDENILDTKTDGAVQPRSLRGRKNEVCVV